MTAHEWQTGAGRAQDPAGAIRVDCHRGLRGPYTGMGSLLRVLVPRIQEARPDLVRAHLTEILSAAPELADLVGPGPETLTSLASPAERTRIYPANRTRRLAHGAVELLTAFAAEQPDPLAVAFDRVEDADHTDQEFLAILLRRCPADRIRVVVATRGEDLSDELVANLGRYSRRVAVPPSVRDSASASDSEARDQDALLHAFIEADGTSTDPAERAAYDRADPDQRARLHEEHAAALDARGERSLWFGAIPYHLEHGTDPAGAGVQALYDATRHCGAMGFYRMVIELGLRGRALVDPATRMEEFWLLSTRVSSAHVALGETLVGEPTYHELRARFADPELHMSMSYALAMLYTRHHPPELRDHRVARAHINNAIAIATLLPDPAERAFQTVFQQNGLALIEMHQGHLDEALRLVDEGAHRLSVELPERAHQLHRSVLLHNRAKVCLALGRKEEALGDFDQIVEVDPNYPDYYFERAEARRQLGDVAGALIDCDTAIAISPPFWELHYNRGDIRAALGDTAGAIADFGYVVELEPDQIQARTNLICLLLDAEQPDRARRELAAGLDLQPDQPELLCLRGQERLTAGDPTAAAADFGRALAADPELVPALAGRAEAAFQHGDRAAAAADLRAALRFQADNSDLWFNLGAVLEAGGDPDAVRAYTEALSVAPDEARAEIQAGLDRCHAAAPAGVR
ncbi:tetratricopeptide (TPR) repeat protein [Catenulispora sp. EB89]|uniref:tetratricopeptide repeat protein n=1 Tax=Catenulispora sp. EB89 TaxID=3156257 RepID=UPI003513854F